MKLYNCFSEGEKALKDTDISIMPNAEIVALAESIREHFRDGQLEDECIVIDALTQIVQEMGERV